MPVFSECPAPRTLCILRVAGLVEPLGVEPSIYRVSDGCVTAPLRFLALVTGVEPATSSLTGKCAYRYTSPARPPEGGLPNKFARLSLGETFGHRRFGLLGGASLLPVLATPFGSNFILYYTTLSMVCQVPRRELSKHFPHVLNRTRCHTPNIRRRLNRAHRRAA